MIKQIRLLNIMVDDLYMTDYDGRIISINGIDYEVVKGISTGDRLSRIALRMHPLSHIALKLKDKVAPKLIPGLVNLMYYIHNKSMNELREQYDIVLSSYIQEEYVADFEPISKLTSEMTTNAFRSIPIDTERIMICTEIYTTNISGIYTIDVADTILDEYIDNTTIVYNVNANTVILE